MKRALVFTVIAIVAALLLAGCNIITGAGPTPTTPDPASLGMSEMEVQQWEDRGVANVDSAEAASVLAGFDVKTPSFLPSGLSPLSRFMVSSNAPILKEMGSDAPVKMDVTRVYGLEGERVPALTIIQVTLPVNRGQGEPVTMCGVSIEKASFSAEGQSYPSVQYVWEQAGINYLVMGYLNGEVTEAALDKVVCSIINQ